MIDLTKLVEKLTDHSIWLLILAAAPFYLHRIVVLSHRPEMQPVFKGAVWFLSETMKLLAPDSPPSAKARQLADMVAGGAMIVCMIAYLFLLGYVAVTILNHPQLSMPRLAALIGVAFALVIAARLSWRLGLQELRGR